MLNPALAPAPAAELLTLADVAKLLQVSPKTVLRREPPGRVKLGRALRFNAAEVRAWIASGCPASSSGTSAQPVAAPTSPPPPPLRPSPTPSPRPAVPQVPGPPPAAKPRIVWK